MARLIDADALDAMYGDWYIEEGTEDGFIGELRGLLDNAPTVDVVRVVHARWYEIRDYSQAGLISFECSACGRLCDTLYRYCPNCGAKMDGDA